MGYVPKLKFHIGQGYPGLTHVALNEFTDAVAQSKAAATAPVRLEQVREERRDPVTIYPDTSGLIPRYTGHIPGELRLLLVYPKAEVCSSKVSILGGKKELKNTDYTEKANV